jgi:cellulose biosynthesis protein BcsQ
VYEVARSAIMASDGVFIPVQPSPYDVWAANEILELYQESDVYKPDVRRAFVINRKIANTAIGRDVKDALADYHLLVLAAAVGLPRRATDAKTFERRSGAYSVLLQAGRLWTGTAWVEQPL